MTDGVWWLVEGVPARYSYLLDGFGVAHTPSVSIGAQPRWVKDRFDEISTKESKLNRRRPSELVSWAFGDSYCGEPRYWKLVRVGDVLPGPDWSDVDGLPEDEIAMKWLRCAWRDREYLVFRAHQSTMDIATLDGVHAASDREWSGLKGPEYMWVRSVPVVEASTSIVPERPRRMGISW